MAGGFSSGTLTYESSLELGDRFAVTTDAGRLLIPEALSALGASVDTLEDEQGRAYPVQPDDTDSSVKVPDPLRPAIGQAAALWLEYRAPKRFRLLAEP